MASARSGQVSARKNRLLAGPASRKVVSKRDEDHRCPYPCPFGCLSIPIAGGECEFTRFDFRNLLVSRAVDVVQLDTCAAPRTSGGIVRVPDGPGLGIEVHRAALARFTA
jgi:hypothetical protein